MFKLIKYFGKKEYAQYFLAGNIYMNSLDYFWQTGFDDQKDIFEGIICTINSEQCENFPDEFSEVLACDLRLRGKGFRYCNIACFFKGEFSPEFTPFGRTMKWSSDDRMDKFGSYVVIIVNEREFINRIHIAIKGTGYKYLCGDVHYHGLKKNGTPVADGPVLHLKTEGEEWSIGVNIPENAVLTHRDVFDKWNRFSWQNEWRIALYRGVKDISPFELHIGDISDIAVLVPIAELENAMQKIVLRADCDCLENGYHGNISRKNMREAFYDLGDRKGVLMPTIG
jgi:hypothetical protein